MTLNWTNELADQLDWHWRQHLRPRLDGLADEEYLWEPVDGAWNLRPREESRTKMAAGAGPLVLDFEYPEPSPAPVTTIAWRIGHLIVGVFGTRVANHFGGAPVDYATIEWPPTAKDALAMLDDLYAAWMAGVRGLSDDDLAKPVGPSEGSFAEFPYAALVLHIHREAIHHGAEILLLRDLYRWQEGR